MQRVGPQQQQEVKGLQRESKIQQSRDNTGPAADTQAPLRKGPSR